MVRNPLVAVLHFFVYALIYYNSGSTRNSTGGNSETSPVSGPIGSSIIFINDFEVLGCLVIIGCDVVLSASKTLSN